MLNWDEIDKKVAYSQPTATPKSSPVTAAKQKIQNSAPSTSFGDVLDEYNTSLPGIGRPYASTLSKERKQEISQGTQRFFEQAPVQAGFMQGVSYNNPVKSLESKLGTQIDTSQAEQALPYKIGQGLGIAAQFAVPYSGASGTVGKITAKAFPKLGKFGQSVAKSVGTDLAVGLPLNANYAFNKEGLQGAEAAKSIAVNTGIDLVAGGILEAVPFILKSGKKVASKADFEALPPQEKQEVMSELERLAYESNVRKGKITPQGDTLYGNASQPIAGELPAPKKTYLHATDKEFEKFKPAGDGLIYFSEKQNGVKTKADAIFSTPANNRMIESQINESKVRHFDPFSDPEAKAIAEKYGLPTDRSYVKWDEISPMSLEAIKKGYNSFEVLEPNGGYSRAIADPDLISITNNIRKSNASELYAAAKGQKEVPRTVTPNEVSGRFGRGIPQAPAQASNLPVQPRNPEKGIEIPKEQTSRTFKPFEYNKYGDKISDMQLNGENYTSYKVNTDSGEYIVQLEKYKAGGYGDRVQARISKPDFWKQGSLSEASFSNTDDAMKYVNMFLDNNDGKITSDELVRLYENIGKKPKPQSIPRASTAPVQPRNIEKGTVAPKEQMFAEIDGLPKVETGLKKDVTYAKALAKTAIDEYDRTVASIADYISNYKPKGVDVGVIPKNGDELMRDGGIRYAASRNDEWYQDFYKSNGRKPNKSESKDLAEKLVKESLRRKTGEFYNEDLGKLVDELNGLKKDLGADTFKGEKTIDDLVNEFGAIPKGEEPRARDISIPKKTDYGEVQQYARTLQESAIVDDNLYQEINKAVAEGSFTKPTKSNKTAVEDANYTIEQGLDEAVTKFKSVLQADKQPTSYDIALGNRVLQELQKSGRYDEALDVAIDLSEMLSETGRTLQAARIAKRLSPEGRLMIATRASKKIARKTGTKVELSPDTIKQISEAKTEKEITEANKKAAIEMWNQVPANWVDKVNSWRYMSMLLNPKTHIRNIVGNSIFLPVREFKNLIGAGLEKALIKNGERTKAVLTPADKELLDFAGKDFENVKSLLKDGGKYDESYRPSEAKVFKTKILESARKFNLGALDTEDTWFMKFAYDSSLAQYMKSNKLKPSDMVGNVLEKAQNYAILEAKKATYRDVNALASLISRGKSTLASGKYGALGRAGNVALEGLVPFTKTPLNIIKRGVAYSPANIARGIANLNRVKSGKVTATEAIDQLASGLSGTALLALGTYLGYNNIVSGKEGEYKDKLYNYNQMIGAQNYSLNIDGNSYTIDWAAPLSMPFFVGVELAKAVKDGSADLAAVLDSMTQISDPMVNLSMLKGINDIMTNNFEGLGQTAMDIGTGYAGQFVPTVGGQIARTLDGTRRSTISTQETGIGRAAEKFGRQQIGKIPGLSQSLEPYIDLWGREQKNASAAENFLSPGYFKQQNLTPVDRELKSLMKQLDPETIKDIVPSSTAYQYTIEANSEKYRLTEKESTQYQKTRGQESFKGLEKLFNSAEYRSMSKEDKVKAISDVYTQAGKTAKMEFLATKGVSPTVILSSSQQDKYNQHGANLGIDEKRFVETMQNVGSIESDPGKLNVSKKKKAYIDQQFPNATKEQKWFLYAMADVSGSVGHYERYKKQFDKKE